MDPAVGSSSIQNNSFLQQAQNDPIAFLQSIDQLLEDFGPEGVGNAASQRFLERFGASLKEIINNSDLPQSIKDAANDIIDAHTGGCNCDANTADAVDNSELAETVDCLCDEASEEVENECACTEESESGGSQAEADAEATNESGTPTALTPDAQAEADAEAENEGTAGSGGASGADGGMTPEDLIRNQAGDDGGRKNGLRGGANWLEVLADSLAKIQSEFLNNAIKASDIMADEAGNAAPSPEEGEGEAAGGGTGTESSRFLRAQASYTANMQMFTIFSNQVSTSIKSIGEALAGISRKQ